MTKCSDLYREAVLVSSFFVENARLDWAAVAIMLIIAHFDETVHFVESGSRQ
jgi:hypothetical protein